MFCREYLNAGLVALAHAFMLGGSSFLRANPGELPKTLLIDHVASRTDDGMMTHKSKLHPGGYV